ncbi:MAG: peptide chain release factor N(5)-glutamine methyltransferase [bacterium]|nr:peptide chain release factor N(5)-glutamine methyltransferase [bacterium]
MQLRQLLPEATKYLEDNQIDTAKTDAEVLLGELMGMNRVQLYLNGDVCLPENRLTQYWELLKRRTAYEPVAYILGKKAFMDWEFMVNPDVLIPRAETEILVEEVIKIGKGLHLSPVLVDIGTGSGIIAISLALALNVRVYATDTSISALEVAKINAAKLGVGDKIVFRHGNLFEPLDGFNLKEMVDIVVSNPPYVATSQWEELPPDVLFEPKVALDGGEEGLVFYEKIIAGSLNYLKQGGRLVLEIGYNQAQTIKDTVLQHKEFDEVKIINDYHGIARVVIAKR